MVLDFVTAGLESYMQKCRGCSAILDYGTNTRFDENTQAHLCNGCGIVL